YGTKNPFFDRLAEAKLAELGPACAARTAARPVREIVSEIQGILKQASCYSGAVDGVWGPRTRNALGEFARKANRALGSGEPDEKVAETVRAIEGVNCEAAEQPRQAAKDPVSNTAPKVSKTVTKAPVVAPKTTTPKVTAPKTTTAKAPAAATKPNARTYSYKVWSTGSIPRGSTYSKSVPPYGTLTCTEPLDGHGDRNCSWR
ncbi:MAG: peptidoglycan-binding domain-containing protein, partial [Rhizobiaceae bacterium]